MNSQLDTINATDAIINSSQYPAQLHFLRFASEKQIARMSAQQIEDAADVAAAAMRVHHILEHVGMFWLELAIEVADQGAEWGQNFDMMTPIAQRAHNNGQRQGA